MALTIWKYDLKPSTHQLIEMPKGARLLTVQGQHSGVCLWAIVNDEAEVEKRAFGVYPTGGDAPGALAIYLNTVQLQGGVLIFHVFEYPVHHTKL